MTVYCVIVSNEGGLGCHSSTLTHDLGAAISEPAAGAQIDGRSYLSGNGYMPTQALARRVWLRV